MWKQRLRGKDCSEEWEKKRLERQRSMGGVGAEGGGGSGSLVRRLEAWERGCRERGTTRADLPTVYRQ